MTIIQIIGNVGLKKIIETLDNSVIVTEGNSLVSGVGGGGVTIANSLDDLTPFSSNGSTVFNVGAGGDQIEDLIGDYEPQVLTKYNESVASILFVWEITNDIYFGATPQEAFDAFKNYCINARNDGFIVIAATTLPRNQIKSIGGTVQDYNDDLDAANTLMLANPYAYCDNIINVREDARLSDYSDATYFSDGIHLTASGYQIMAEKLKNAIIELVI